MDSFAVDDDEYSKSMTFILPYLAIGGEFQAAHFDNMLMNGITHILNVADLVCREHFPGQFMYIGIDMAFDPKNPREWLKSLAGCFAFIELVREAGGICLMHCTAGKNVSPAVAMAYLMQMHSIPLEDAYLRVAAAVQYKLDFRRKDFLGLFEFEKTTRDPAPRVLPRWEEDPDNPDAVLPPPKPVVAKDIAGPADEGEQRHEHHHEEHSHSCGCNVVSDPSLEVLKQQIKQRAATAETAEDLQRNMLESAALVMAETRALNFDPERMNLAARIRRLSAMRGVPSMLDIVITQYSQLFMQKFMGLITGGQIELLGTLRTYFTNAPRAQAILRRAVFQFGCAAGASMLEQLQSMDANAIQYTTGLWQLWLTLKTIVREHLGDDVSFLRVANAAYRHVLMDSGRSGKMFADSVTMLLMPAGPPTAQQQQQLPEMSEVQDATERAVDLYCLLDSTQQQMFEKFYTHALSVRLLRGLSEEQMELEQAVVTTLQRLLPQAHFVDHIRDMVRDVMASTEFSQKLPKAKTPGQIALGSAQLLSQAWPEQSVFPQGRREAGNVVLPTKMQATWDHFTKLYTEKHSGRDLTLMSHMGDAEVAYRAGGKATSLIVSTHQAVVMSAFNDADSLSYQDIQIATNIDPVMLKQALWHLCFGVYAPRGSCSQGGVFVRVPARADAVIDDTDVFTLNSAFVSKAVRVKVSNGAVRPTAAGAGQ
eukprot:TRINITY_DN6863_c0_g1_i1.p1 TRINITY_DN6863_c0_g1~~TRINITY_DN6863_c0_g1_i1.p1  ORF type:complete len:708 (+),score=197.71 TRINITY_DN6863_c0_g1_i1:1362-3485(+)